MKFRIHLLVLFVSATVLNTSSTRAENRDRFFEKDKLRALILAGRNNHDWRASSQFLKQLLVKTKRFDVRILEEPAGITAHTLSPYDVLVLAPGASPIKPPIPGIDLTGIFSLRTIPDSRQIKMRIAELNAKRAVVVGGGYIGMEMTENLLKLGLAVTIVEMQPHVMPLLDPEMAAPIHDESMNHGVVLRLNETVVGFEHDGDHAISVKFAGFSKTELD